MITRRRVGRLLLVSAAAVAALFVVRSLGTRAHRFAERRLAQALGRPTTIGRLSLHFFPPEIELQDVRVASQPSSRPPFFEAARVVIRPSLLSGLQSRIVLARLRLDQPRFYVAAYAGGGDNLPSLGTGAGGREVRIRRLVVEGGEVVVDHERVPLDLDLPRFTARLFGKRAGVLAGRVSFAPGRVRFGAAATMPVETDLDLELDGRRLSIAEGQIRALHTHLAVKGDLVLKDGVNGTLETRGPVDLSELDQHVFHTSLGLKGQGSWLGRALVGRGSLGFEGRLEGRGGAFDGLEIPRFDGGVSWGPSGLQLRGLHVDAFAGSGTLDVDVPAREAPIRMAGTAHDVDAESVAAYIFRIGSPGVGARLTGDFDLRWPKGRARELSGRMAFDLAPAGDGRTPLSGRLEWKADRGHQVVESADLQTPTTTARLGGTIDVDRHTSLDVDGTSADLAATDDLGARLLRALGSPDARPVGFSGRGGFKGRWGGTLGDPVFEGRFVGPDVSYLGVNWGEADWEGEVDRNEVRSRSLVLRRGPSTLRLSGRNETGRLGDRDGVDLRFAFSDWPAEDFVKALEWDIEIQGPVSGEAQVQDRRSAPRGTARLTCVRGRYYGFSFSDLDLDAEMQGPVTVARAGRARIGGGTLVFAGSRSDAGVMDVDATLTDAEIEDLAPSTYAGPRLAGRVSGHMVLRGTVERPGGVAEVRSRHLFFGDEGIGALEATVRGAGDGVLNVEARSRSPRLDATLSGTVSAASPYVADLELRARETSLDPYLRVAAAGVPSALQLIGTGAVKIRGALNSPKNLEADADVARLDVALPEYRMTSARAVRGRYAAGRFTLQAARFTGEGTDVEVSGSAGPGDADSMDLLARGRADLRVISVFTDRLRGRGAAQLRLNVSGTTRDPRLDGLLEIEGGGIRVRGLPQGIEDVRGSLRFTENVAVLQNVVGTVGGGAVSLEGQAAYAKGRLGSFDIRAVGDRVALRYPEGVRSLVGVNVRFFGDLDRQWVTGTVDVREAVLTRRYEVASDLFASAPELGAVRSLYEGLRYDVLVRAPGTLKVDNNLATLAARAELRLQGTYDRPVLLGRAEIDSGRVYFQGRSYAIRHGTLDFANPQRVDPFFDIEGETRVRSYSVTLRLNGTLERVTPTLSSDPPLDNLGILSLLAGAPESTVTDAAFQSGTDRIQQNLAVAGAAALVSRSAPVTREVQHGVERVAESVGLSRFSIDPSLARGSNTNPTARLTVGKRITPNIDFYYSVDLKSTEEKLYSAEYTVSDRVSILVTRAQPQGLGVDLRLKKSR